MKRLACLLLSVLLAVIMLGGCGSSPTTDVPEETQAAEEVTKAPEEPATEAENPVQEESAPAAEIEDYTGDDRPDNSEDQQDDDESEEIKDVDLIFFMGQSNMSGAAGDASQAPYVPPEAGMEFRSVSDPTTLYPVTEPFGVNENNPTGLYEYPGAKKGSMVSAFVNEYHELTGRRVIAVSVSMGATDMSRWLLPSVMADVKGRFDRAKAYLTDNGYNIGHIYALWLHGESDAIEKTDPAVYRGDLDEIMRPLFIGGLQKVFIITPGRTIDYRDIFLPIIEEQKEICRESGYYALATTVLTGVSTEFMRDQYHYDQHVLNLVGLLSARSVAYFTEHGKEMAVYDYREGGYIIPEGVDEDSAYKEEPIELEDLNIDEEY